MRALRIVAILLLGAAPLAGQASLFGTRGFGLPLRPISVRAFGTGGSFGLFDYESSLNPSSFASLARVNATFQTVQTWTSSENPIGTASTRDNRYPGFTVTTPVGGVPLAIAISATGYTDRNFSLASVDTIILRDAPVEARDTITSLGGISDLRAAISWRQTRNVHWGLGFHLLTGSNRITSHRVFADSAYTGATEKSTLSYLSYGVSAGVTVRVAAPLTLAAMVRADNSIRVERDTTRVGSIRLPLTAAGGVRFQLGKKTLIAGSVMYRTWSRSDSALVALGGTGSRNTLEWNAGFEFTPDPNRPGSRPIRFGVYRAELPFPVQAGLHSSETGVSAGSSLEFAAGRARGDLTVSRVWRNGGEGFSERAFLLNVGLSLRP